MKILSPSIMRLEKPVETCAKVLNSLGCKSVHIDVSPDLHLPGFFGEEFLTSGQLNLFDCPATIHLFLNTTFERIDTRGVRKNDRVMLHVFPGTSQDQIHALMRDAACTGYKPAIALDIESAVDAIIPFIKDLGAVYVMGIPVATHGLPPNGMTRRRMEILREVVRSINPSCIIGIDGGINNGTFADIAMLADEIVIGGLLFNAPNIYSQWDALNAWLEKIDGGGI